ncbi:MAG: 30S ribosomal protein S3 [Dehalococcoidales bacterium]|nr:MAG: 30S ribosomal protein S3 [Dehalococcoidales bacterium]
MGHKVHPMGFRIGVIRDWQAKWYSDKHYAEFLQEDLKLRKAIEARYADAAVSLVEIERQANQVTMTVHTARPGIVIGRGGQRVDETRRYLEQLVGKRVQLNINEVQQPELDAHLVAKNVAEQIERRIAYRRAMRQVMIRTMQAGAKGMKVSCAGRLGGAEIARRQTMHEGQVPLHTLRADIDYGFVEARTNMGRIGVKVWIYKGEILPEAKEEEVEEMPAELAAEISESAAPADEVAEEAVATVVEEIVSPVAAPEPETAEVEEAPAEPVAEAGAEAVSTEKAAEEAPKKTTRGRPRKTPVAKVEVAEVEEAPPEAVTDDSIKNEESNGVKEDDVTAEAG